jgi:hypothetical protein
MKVKPAYKGPCWNPEVECPARPFIAHVLEIWALFCTHFSAKYHRYSDVISHMEK